MKKFRNYFIGGALAKTDDVFEHVKAEVLFNFTVFFIITNIPYLFISAGKAIQLSMGISTLVALILGLVILKKTNSIKHSTYFFLINFTIQDVGHYILNNGRLAEQGILFGLLFALCGYLLLDRRWGFFIAFGMVLMFILGTYNQNNNCIVWKVPPDMSDPVEAGPLKYFALIPMFLNIYLISQFVKARQKAERQLSEQKELIEEKQKDILDSIRYARRIQQSLLPNEKFIEKVFQKLKK